MTRWDSRSGAQMTRWGEAAPEPTHMWAEEARSLCGAGMRAVLTKAREF